LLKLLPIGKDDHEEEITRSGTGDKLADVRKKSILSVKRIGDRVERDLAKNHPFD
jgi:hypothetical protein